MQTTSRGEKIQPGANAGHDRMPGPRKWICAHRRQCQPATGVSLSETVYRRMAGGEARSWTTKPQDGLVHFLGLAQPADGPVDHNPFHRACHYPEASQWSRLERRMSRRQRTNEILRSARHWGRAIWKRWTRYHVRSRVKARMNCLKLFGEGSSHETSIARLPKSGSALPL